jgi:hypothetical protein
LGGIDVTQEQLLAIADACLTEVRARLHCKNSGYTRIEALQNFRVQGVLQHGTPKQAMWRNVTKHLAALSMMVDDPTPAPVEQWAENLGDVIAYMLLIEAAVVDEIGSKEVVNV